MILQVNKWRSVIPFFDFKVREWLITGVFDIDFTHLVFGLSWHFQVNCWDVRLHVPTFGITIVCRRHKSTSTDPNKVLRSILAIT